MASIGKEYLATAIRRLKYYKDLGDKTFEQLDEKDFHYLPSPESNSIAIIVQHMHGNMISRWTDFLTEDGEKEWRKRDEEFETHPVSQHQVLDLWEKGWACFFDALLPLRKKDLLRLVHIRGEYLTVVDAINRQLAHYSYHTGQIVYIAKMVRDKNWKTLSIPKGQSGLYNSSPGVKDPPKNH